MGCAQLFCCFRNQQPNCMAFTGLGASILSFAFLIWGLVDLFPGRKAFEALYVIAFVLIILCMLAFITLVIFLNLRKTDSFRTINNIGRIICLVILCMCGVAFLFLLIASIIKIVDFAKDESEASELEKAASELFNKSKDSDDDDDNGKVPGHLWAALFIPSIISLIALVIMALVANILYKVFMDNVNSTPNPVPVNITQNTMTTIPNYPQPGMFPNNNGPVPPMVNNVAYPVTIQQSGVNLNK